MRLIYMTSFFPIKEAKQRIAVVTDASVDPN